MVKIGKLKDTWECQRNHNFSFVLLLCNHSPFHIATLPCETSEGYRYHSMALAVCWQVSRSHFQMPSPGTDTCKSDY